MGGRFVARDDMRLPTNPRQDADKYDPLAAEAEERELTALIGRVDTAALAARATQLRGGVPCSVPPFRYDRATRSSVMGGMNYHIIVTFEDGIRWIARIRRFNSTSPPPVLRDYIIRSEVATLQFLERTSVPAPKVLDYAFEDDGSPVGVGYILMEMLPGKSLRWPPLCQSAQKKIMDQLADIFIELAKYTFQHLGSLDRPGDLHVGPFARESLTDFDGSTMHAIGPLSSVEEYYIASLRLILDLILREEMYSQRPVDAYLIHRFLLDLVPSVLPASAYEEKAFYLKHADDKGDHILVDDDFNITGIIDWEWAHTASAAHAFNSPIAFLPVAHFYDGANDLGDEEVAFAEILAAKGRDDLAGYVRNGRLQHRFAFCCGYDLEDWNGFLGLFRGLRDAVGIDDGLDWDEWKSRALDRYNRDSGLQILLSRGINASDVQ